MVDLPHWRASIGRFHAACVSRFFSDRVRALVGSRLTKWKDHVDVSTTDVIVSWLCLVFLFNFVLCFKKVTSDAVWSPFDDSLFYNISVFSDLKFVTSVNAVNVVPLSVSFMADSVLPVTRYATTFIFVLFALGQRRLKFSNDVEENPGPDPIPVPKQ